MDTISEEDDDCAYVEAEASEGWHGFRKGSGWLVVLLLLLLLQLLMVLSLLSLLLVRDQSSAWSICATSRWPSTGLGRLSTCGDRCGSLAGGVPVDTVGRDGAGVDLVWRSSHTGVVGSAPSLAARGVQLDALDSAPLGDVPPAVNLRLRASSQTRELIDPAGAGPTGERSRRVALPAGFGLEKLAPALRHSPATPAACCLADVFFDAMALGRSTCSS